MSLPVDHKLNEATLCYSLFSASAPSPDPIHPSPCSFALSLCLPISHSWGSAIVLVIAEECTGFCVSVFDDEVAVVKNEAGGGNSSTLEQRLAAFWQREARRRLTRH